MSVVEKLSLDLYSETIESYAKGSVDSEFFNSGDEHAMIVLSLLVQYAKESIHIYCGNLCSEVSNNQKYLNNLREFFKRGGNAKVALCELDTLKIDSQVVNKDIFKLFSEFSSQVSIKTTNKKVVENTKQVHFTIADDKAYRLETDIVCKKARGNFGSEKVVAVLECIFWKIFNDPDSKPLQLSAIC